jgi:predicted metalloprotease with PDZ domain
MIALAIAGAAPGFGMPPPAAEEVPEKGWLGVALVDQDPDDATPGVFVAHVLSGGPAAEAGLAAGDLIRAVGDRRVVHVVDLSAELASHSPGERLTLEVQRNDIVLHREVVLGHRRDDAYVFGAPDRLVLFLEQPEHAEEEALHRSLEAYRLAMEVRRTVEADVKRLALRSWHLPEQPLRITPWGAVLHLITPELRTHFGAPGEAGALVARVAPESAAGDAGLLVGDLVVQVGPHRLAGWSDLVRALGEDPPGDPQALQVIRDGEAITLTLSTGATLDPSCLDELLAAGAGGEDAQLRRKIRELEAKIEVLEHALQAWENRQDDP